MRGYPQFSFWISIALAEICFPRIVKNSTKNTSLLVSTVLNCLYPFLLYAVVAWGSVYKTHLQTLSSKQNTVLRTLFFTTPSGPYTERALPFLNLLEVLRANVPEDRVISVKCGTCFQNSKSSYFAQRYPMMNQQT